MALWGLFRRSRGLDRTAGNPARPKPHLNSYSIGVRFGVGVVAESNDQAASDAAVRDVTPGARSQDTKTIG